MKLLLLSLTPASAEAVSQALSGQGYEIIIENGLNLDQVLAIDPELLVTEASPSDLTCCGLITSLKTRTSVKPLRVLMIVHGEALERARALDLGADDVAPFPFDAAEFAARVRTLFRARQSEDEL